MSHLSHDNAISVPHNFENLEFCFWCGNEFDETTTSDSEGEISEVASGELEVEPEDGVFLTRKCDAFRFLVNKESNELISVVILADVLAGAFRNMKAMKSTSIFNGTHISIPAESLYRVYPSLNVNAVVDKTRHTLVNKFLRLVKPYYEKRIERIKEAQKEGRIAFWDLWYMFKGDCEVMMRTRETLFGGVVKSFQYNEEFFTDFALEVTYVQTDGTEFAKRSFRTSIPVYDGYMLWDELPVKHITLEQKQLFAERGKKFAELACCASHMQYDGKMFKQSWSGVDIWHMRGRVMVDVISFCEEDSNYREFRNVNEYGERKVAIATLDSSHWWMAWPTLPAFCLTTKKWGEVHVAQLKPIEFRENAFDRLVLEVSTKRIINAIVDTQMENKDMLFGDIIAGKGNGAIILLHGPPGVGKTSTAEAVAEKRKCPLYSITVGELGTNPEKLESRLQRVLDIASRWGAVILLDEADIFLEARTANDVRRNAMVSIFLRLLEYHSGVLFMTTNRVGNFDPAFMSRINIGLTYKAFDTETRAKLWKSLLTCDESKTPIALQTDDVIDQFKSYDLNGRQIRNIIRLAGALAVDEKREMTIDDLFVTIRFTMSFAAEIGNTK